MSSGLPTRFALALAPLGLLGLVACSSTKLTFTATDAPHRPSSRRAPGDVQIFDEPPTRSFVEVGTLEAHSDEASDKVLAKLRKKAGELGCDGLVVDGALPATKGWETKLTHDYRTTCIVFDFTDDAAASTASSGSQP